MLLRGEGVTNWPESMTAVLSGEVALNTCSQRGVEAQGKLTRQACT